jgi:hypothetical protein
VATTYAFSQSAGTYTPISGGTVLGTAANDDQRFNNSTSSQNTSTGFPIGFNFVYNGTTYSTFAVNTNGWIKFGTGTSFTIEGTTTGISAGGFPAVVGMGMDLIGKTGLSELSYLSTGAAPNRKLIVQWKSYSLYTSSGANTSELNFQIVLNETTNTIDVIYGDVSTPATVSGTAEIGIKSGSAIADINNRTSTTSWGVTTAGTSTTSSITFNSTIVPSSGLTYTWTALSCTGTPTAGSIATATRNVCVGSAPGVVTVTGANPPVIGISYQWEQSTDSGANWANAVGGTNATTTSYTPPLLLVSGTQYRMRTTCANGGGSVISNTITMAPVAPATQATALTVTAANTFSTSFTASWTVGDGARRIVVISNAAITNPINANAPALVANNIYAGTGQQIVYDGTGTGVTVYGLTCNTPYFVKVFDYNRCGSGPYDYYYNTVTGTNALTVTTAALPAAVVLSVTNNFTGFTGANLGTAVSGWYEASVPTAALATPVLAYPGTLASTWTSSTVFSGVTTAKLNLFSNLKNEWIISPKMTITAASRVKFKAAITDLNSAAADPGRMVGTDDKVRVMISTDGCGASWTTLYTFDASNTTTLTNALQDFIVAIPATYNGQTVQIAFVATDGTIDDAPDYDFHVGNIVIELTPQCDVTGAVTITNVTKNGATVSWTVPPTGIPTGYQYVVSTTSTAPTGAGTATTGTSVNVGSLASSTQYYVYVRTVCGADFSSWSLVKSFVTLCNYPDLTSTTPGSVCGQGTVTLQAAAPAGSTIKWYANTTDAASLATGASYTTPVITASTNYYVSTGQPASGATVQIGAGATTAVDVYSNPFYSLWSNNHTQHIITAAELQAFGLSAGNINSISLNVTAAGTLPMIDLAIKIGTTTATDMSAFVANGAFATVYTSASYMPTTGINTFTFTAPFNWDGTSNLVVEFCHGNSASSSTMSRTVTADVTSYVSTIKQHYAAATSSTTACGTTTGGTVASFSLRPQFYFNGVGLCMSPRTLVAATVNTPPSLTLSGNPAAICSGQTTAAVTITAGAASYDSYVWSPTTGVSGNATTGWTFNPATTTAYVLTSTNTVSGCVKTTPVNVTVNSLPSAVTISPNPLPVCEGTSAPIALQGAVVNVNAIVGTGTTAPSTTSWPNPFNAWYGGTKTQILFKASELTAQGLIANTNINALAFDFAASVASQCNDLTIKIGNTTVANMTTGFEPSTSFTTVYNASFTPTAGTTGFVSFPLTTQFMWTGGDIIVEIIQNAGNGGNGLGTTTRTTTTTYDSVYYGAKDNVTPAGAASFAALTMTDFTTGTSARGTSASRPNVKFSQSINNAVTWSPATNLFTDAAATIPYTGQNLPTVYTKPTAATTYVATVTNAAGCSITASVNVTINVVVAPTVPAATQDICNAGTVANLVATGTAIKWYAAASGGAALAPTVALVNGTTYYASQTVSGCESVARTALAVNINVVAAPAIANSAQTFCNAGTVADLMPNGASIKWYAAATGGTALASTVALVNGTTYYASQTVNGCEGLVRGSVTATINVVAAPAISNDAQVFCNNATIDDLLPNGAEIKWYTTSTGGTPLVSPAVLVSGTTYYASQTVDGCEGLLRGAVTATVLVTPAPAAADQTFCNAATVADLLPNGTEIKWYADATGGTPLLATDALVSGTTYYASQTIDGCEGLVRSAAVATVNVTPAPTGDDEQEFCTSGTVGDLVAAGNAITWYDDATAGNALTVDTALVDGTTYYASQSIDGCVSLTRLAVTAVIHTVVVDVPQDVSVCTEYVLPALTSGAYYTQTGGQGTELAAGSVITETATLYVYAQEGTDVVCSDENSFTVTVANIAAPTGDDTQTIEANPITDAFVSDLQADAQGTVVWYATLADAQAGTNPLAADTLLVQGATYYATQTVDTCTSVDVFAVTVDIVLDREGFDIKAFSFYPNPVKDVLNISYSSEITTVTVFNLLGQKVISQQSNADEVKIDMSSLADGAYIVNVTSGNTVKTIKVIKKQ